MTVEDVRVRVGEIAEVAGDAESAHAKEDELRQAVLEAIANGHPDPAGLAAAALDPAALKFPRWCA